MRAGMGGASLLLSVFLLGDALGGTLGDFESAVDKPHASSRSASDDSSDGSFMDEVFGNCLTTAVEAVIVGVFQGVKWLFYDWWAEPSDLETETSFVADQAVVSESTYSDTYPFSAQYAVPDGHVGSEADEFASDYETEYNDLEGLQHRLGTPGMPYVRFDYRWQYLSQDLDANDFLLEAGYKYAALYARYTQYEDHSANEDLDIEQYYGLFRVGGTDDFFFTGSFQIGLGVGGYVIHGDVTHGGAALTVPVMLYPADWWGIEFRPAWASINDKTISDYDLSVSIGYRLINVRTGYRWLWVQGEGHWLNGPYAGVSAFF